PGVGLRFRAGRRHGENDRPFRAEKRFLRVRMALHLPHFEGRATGMGHAKTGVCVQQWVMRIGVRPARPVGTYDIRRLQALRLSQRHDLSKWREALFADRLDADHGLLSSRTFLTSFINSRTWATSTMPLSV